MSTGSTLATAKSQPHALAQLLERLESSPGVVVFDLDSTLLDNRPRQAQILRDFGSLRGQPGFAAVTAAHFDDWDLKRALVKAGMPREAVEEIYTDLRTFWLRWFFTDAYCHCDVPIAGAPEFVSEVQRMGARIVYLSGRPREMLAGTLRSLDTHGFPTGNGVTVMLKPDPLLFDDTWKLQACAAISELGPVIAAFDNEPTHINGYRSTWPEALCYQLDTDHSGRPVQLLPDMHRIPDFVF